MAQDDVPAAPSPFQGSTTVSAGDAAGAAPPTTFGLLAAGTTPMKDPGPPVGSADDSIGDAARFAAIAASLDQATINALEQRAAAQDQGFPMGERKKASAYDGLQNVVAALGTMGDKRSANKFRVVRALTRVEIDAMYRGNWIASRIVDAIAEDACREWVMPKWKGRDKDEVNLQALQEAERAFSMRMKVVEADKWARLYGGSAIVIGVKGATNLAEELDYESIGKGDLELIHVVDRWRLAASGPVDTDPSSPNFGKPLYYSLTEAEQTVANIHWTRLILFHGKRVPYFEWLRNGRWHDSVLQNLDENVKDYEATRVGIAGLVFNSDLDVLSVRNLKEMLAEDDGENQLVQRVALGVRLRSTLRVWLMDAGADGQQNTGDSWQQKTVSFTGLNDVFERVCMYDVCGASEIPMTRMFGRSPGGMNSTGDSDQKNYEAKLRNHQTSELYEPLLQLYRILCRHVMGTVPPEFDIVFNPVSQLSATEKATIELQRAQRDAAYMKEGAVAEHVVARQLFDDKVFPSMQEADVELVKELATQPTPEELAAAAAGGDGGDLGVPGAAKKTPAA